MLKENVHRELNHCHSKLVSIFGAKRARGILKPLKKLVSTENSELLKLYCKLSTIFGTTHLVEAAFSALTFVKSKYRSSLSDKSVDAQLRCSLYDKVPDFDALAKMKQPQVSH